MSEAHHERGMSRWPAILACGCFEGGQGGADADFGTEKHAQLAQLLLHLRNNGHLPPRESDGFFDAGVYRAAETIRDSLIANNVTADALHIEDRVTLEDGVFGTADIWFEDENDRLFVWDFKTFRNPGRDYTAQLAGYALAICQTEEANGRTPRHEIHLRTLYGDSAMIDSTMLDLYELQQIRDEVMTAFDKAAQGTAQPTQCNWCELCAHKAGCQAYAAIAEAVTSTPALADSVQHWDVLTSQEKAQRLLLAEAVTKWAEGVRAAGKADLASGKTICDEANGILFKLRAVAGRKTPRMAEACRRLIGLGVQPDAIRERLKFGATDIKDLLKTVGLKGKAAEAILEEVCDLGAGSTQLVRG